jgi:hypothetical protein
MSAAPRPSASDVTKAAKEAGGYEFADLQKESFRALAASTSFVGVCTMLLGGLACFFFAGALYLGFALWAVGAAVLAIGCMATAWWMVSAGRSLSALVATRGRDVEHLMEAVSQLRRLFGLARVVIVAFSMLLVVIAGVVVWCGLVTDRGGGKCLGLGL